MAQDVCGARRGLPAGYLLGLHLESSEEMVKNVRTASGISADQTQSLSVRKKQKRKSGDEQETKDPQSHCFESFGIAKRRLGL